jgi:hypothetical protein
MHGENKVAIRATRSKVLLGKVQLIHRKRRALGRDITVGF